MVRELLEVSLLLVELLPQLEELLLLALPDGVVLLRLLTSLEGVSVLGLRTGQLGGVWGEILRTTHPWPPVLGGAPVSPAPMRRAEVAKVRLASAGRTALVMVVRSMLAGLGNCLVNESYF